MSLYIYAYTYIYHICIGALEMHIRLCYPWKFGTIKP
jgi:hypothetical protein